MKNLKELQGVKLLTRNEQKQIIGGIACDTTRNNYCPGYSICCTSGTWEGLCRISC